MKSFLVYFQLLEGGEVDYVSCTPIIHQDFSCVETLDHDHNDQGVIMGLLHPPGVIFWEIHVLVHSSLL